MTTCRRIEGDPYLTPLTKNNMKQIKYINKRNKTIKLLKETEKKLPDAGLGNDFLDVTPKTQAANTKINSGACLAAGASF